MVVRSAGSANSASEVSFPAAGELLAGTLRLPAVTESSAPCVVMGHGFGAVRQAGLDAYAARFAEAGYVSLTFDYRHFGSSGGEPRQLLDPSLQLADWASAVTYARTLEAVDPDRIVLWGTSFGGGHVLALAARDPRVAAVISQVPHVSGPASARAVGVRQNLRLGAAGIRDLLGSKIGRPPYRVPIVGPPGTLAAMTTPDAEPGYRALVPPEFSWHNEVCARVFLDLARYSPGRGAARVGCPVLIQIATKDRVTPPAPARATARRLPHGELIEYPIGHFEIYRGDPFERAVADQLAFLHRVTPLRPAIVPA